MHWRRFAISSIPTESLEAFDTWLQDQWNEKDKLLEYHAKTGHFPFAEGQKINTEVQLGKLNEAWRFWGLLVICIGLFGWWTLGWEN